MTDRRPLAAWTASAVILVVHVVTAIVGTRPGRVPLWETLLLPRSLALRVAVGGQFAPLVADEPWRLLTCVLLHADALHLVLNATALLALGRLLEGRFGAVRWSAWLVIGGVAGAVLSHLAGVRHSDGASGGAFALLGAGIVWGWRHRASLDADERWMLGPVSIGFLVLNGVIGALVPTINNVAHLGGLLAGVVLAALPDRPWLRRLEAVALGAFVGGVVFGWTLG